MTQVHGDTGAGVRAPGDGTAGWAIAHLGVNATLAAPTSIIPDHVPDRQRTRVSGLVGMMTSVAMVAMAVDLALAVQLVRSVR
ncbi:hypothetical protein [Planobispora takensis]|uniref:Uncharacterized protein n=1 Tax=Planobispora takensis TaxID=1367882 RepID=A0A8J3T101_9ACTN|nr:hypothetical protein [Planobispora takensis]GII01995.1 hypothetical protein Pta02_40030 [Planobispora takensis]